MSTLKQSVAKTKDVKFYIHVVIGIALMFIIGALPNPEPITPIGMKVLGVFVGTLYLFTACDVLWGSFLGLIAMGLTGYTTVDAAFTSCMGQGMVMQMFISMALCEGIRASGAIDKAAIRLLSRKSLSGKPIRFLIVCQMAFFLMGFVVGPVPAAILAWSIFYTLAEKIGYEKGDKFYSTMIVVSFLSGFVGGMINPFVGVVAGEIAYITGAMQVAFSTGLYLVVSFVVYAIFVYLMVLTMKHILKCDLSKLEDLDAESLAGENAEPMTGRQKILLASFFVAMIYVVLSSFIPATTAVGAALAKIGTTGFFALLVVVLCIIRMDGKPLMELGPSLKNGVFWGVLLATGVMMTIAPALTSEEVGVSAFLNATVGKLLGQMPIGLFVIVVIVFTNLLTGVFSNMSTAIIVVTVALPVAVNQGFSAIALCMGIILSSNMGILTPAGGGVAPLLFGNENLTKGSLYKALLPNLAIYTVYMVVLTFVFNLVF